MPIAKLSREFYERLGQQATDELFAVLNMIESGHRTALADRVDLLEDRVASLEKSLNQLVGGGDVRRP